MATSLDSHFLWLIVHDLRNPLNVISLTLRLLEETVPKTDPGVQADLGLLGENVNLLERMLSRLSDYSRLHDGQIELDVMPFDPRRLADEVVERHNAQTRDGSSPARLEVADDCPARVELDPSRAQLALSNALTNAAASAEGSPIRVRLSGGPERLTVEVIVDRPPRETVGPAELRPDRFEKLLGTAMERLSLELALSARVSELFGGQARLDATPEKGTAVVLDWPARVDSVPAEGRNGRGI